MVCSFDIVLTPSILYRLYNFRKSAEILYKTTDILTIMLHICVLLECLCLLDIQWSKDVQVTCTVDAFIDFLDHYPRVFPLTVTIALLDAFSAGLGGDTQTKGFVFFNIIHKNILFALFLLFIDDLGQFIDKIYQNFLGLQNLRFVLFLHQIDLTHPFIQLLGHLLSDYFQIIRSIDHRERANHIW